MAFLSIQLKYMIASSPVDETVLRYINFLDRQGYHQLELHFVLSVHDILQSLMIIFNA